MTWRLQISGSRVEQAFLCLLAVAFSLALVVLAEVPDQKQAQEYDAEAPKTILELQQFRQSSSIAIRSKGGQEGTATLVNLNPAINAWYVLKIVWKNGSPEAAHHLENPNPDIARVLLDESYPSGLVITVGKNRHFCDLFAGDALSRAKASPLIYYPLCESRVYVRKRAVGYRTTLETATEFLRERVWGGEKIIALGHILMGDRRREAGKIQTETPGAAGTKGGVPADLPLPALIDSRYAHQLLTSGNLGIDLEGPDRTGMTPGGWYAASGNPGVYVSILQPNLIDGAILQSYRSVVNNLDSVEASALSYLVAFDLDRFELG